MELRIDMVRDSDDFEFHWTYQTFRVAGALDEYRFTIGGEDGSHGGDRMNYHNNQQFSTYDSVTPSRCAVSFRGGWWYNSCHDSNLNGLHTVSAGISGGAGIRWSSTDLSSVEMKVRVKQCHLAAEGTSC